MKILEICPYSSGGCGVWARAKQESVLLSERGYEVMILSSNIEKGSEKIISSEDTLEKIKIFRYPAKKLGGESFMFFLNKEAIKKAIEYSPDIIITHNYRHLHTTASIKLAKKIRKSGKICKVFLVTHAPFVEGNITRTKIQTFVVNLYDKTIGKWTINKFDKILPISKWEIPYLKKIGAKDNKIYYFPNGIPKEFFELRTTNKEENKIIFLGRVAPKKKIETTIESFLYLKNKKIKFEIVGPYEEEYLKYLKQKIKKLKLEKRIMFSKPIYDLKNKIDKLDSSKVYILASRVEGMPQGIIEAMARGKRVIGSNSIAILDLIEDKKNGYLFEFDNPKDLAKKIDLILKDNRVGKNAKESVKKFNWDFLIEKLIKLF